MLKFGEFTYSVRKYFPVCFLPGDFFIHGDFFLVTSHTLLSIEQAGMREK